VTPQELEEQISHIAGPGASPAERALLLQALAGAEDPPAMPAGARRAVDRTLAHLPPRGRRWLSAGVGLVAMTAAGWVGAQSAPRLGTWLAAWAPQWRSVWDAALAGGSPWWSAAHAALAGASPWWSAAYAALAGASPWWSAAYAALAGASPWWSAAYAALAWAGVGLGVAAICLLTTGEDRPRPFSA